jgi:hypothetical protein
MTFTKIAPLSQAAALNCLTHQPPKPTNPEETIKALSDGHPVAEVYLIGFAFAYLVEGEQTDRLRGVIRPACSHSVTKLALQHRR